MLEDLLHKRPPIVHRTYRLLRVHESLRGLIISHAPVYLCSHWRKGRTYPCVRTLLGDCPWCAATPQRQHAYIGIVAYTPARAPTRCILELSPASLQAAMTRANVFDPYARPFDAQRTYKKSPVELRLLEPLKPEEPVKTPIDTNEIVRTLAKVYALPDPSDHGSEEAWLLAVRLRVNSLDYTPAKHQDEEN
jgi:hypothetical protein